MSELGWRQMSVSRDANTNHCFHRDECRDQSRISLYVITMNEIRLFFPKCAAVISFTQALSVIQLIVKLSRAQSCRSGPTSKLSRGCFHQELTNRTEGKMASERQTQPNRERKMDLHSAGGQKYECK